MESYEQLLDKVYEKLPQQSLEIARFETPKVRGHIQGNNTIISNFHQIADTLQRPPEHLLKYVLKELATPGELKKSGIIIGSKVAASRINEKIEKYCEEFVICRQCKKPDTKLLKEGNYTFLKCMACGGKYTV